MDSSGVFTFRSFLSGGRCSRLIGFVATGLLGGVLSANAADDVLTYQFNAADQLGSVNLASASIASFAYDGDGLRTRKQTGSETVFYLRDDAGNVIAEYDQNGALVAEYVYSNSQRAAKIEPGDQRFYYHADIVGTPLVITDSSGSQSFRGEYRPFGTEEEATGTRDRRSFTGKEYDGEFGLFYFNARYYNSRLGRFISTDPVAGDLTAPQSWNRYAYVENNPLKYNDPTGKILETLWDAANVVMGVGSLGYNVWHGNWGAAALDAGGVVVDVAATATPFVPGGAGAAIKAGRAGARVANAVDNAVDAGKAVDRAADAARAGDAAADAARGTDYVVTSAGEAVSIPNGATGPHNPQRGSGMVYDGGSGGRGMDDRVTGVRIMDANQNQGRRVNYMNQNGQTVDPATGRTISNSDPRGHIPLRDPKVQ